MAVVAILVAIAAIIAFILSTPRVGTYDDFPLMFILSQAPADFGCTGDVCAAQARVDAKLEISEYDVEVLRDGAVAIPRARLQRWTNITGGGLTLWFDDVDADGRVSTNDTFSLRAVAPQTQYVLRVTKVASNTVKGTAVFLP